MFSNVRAKSVQIHPVGRDNILTLYIHCIDTYRYTYTVHTFYMLYTFHCTYILCTVCIPVETANEMKNRRLVLLLNYGITLGFATKKKKKKNAQCSINEQERGVMNCAPTPSTQVRISYS